MKVLFLSRWFPYPPDNGSKIRILNLIKRLSVHNEVHLISFFNSTDSIGEDSQSKNLKFCKSVTAIPYRPYNPQGFRAIAGLFSLKPRSIVDSFNVEFNMEVEKMINGHHFDLVIASQIDMAPYAVSIRSTPKLLEEIEVSVIKEAFQLERNFIKKLRKILTWWKLSFYLKRLLPVFNGCTVVSNNERDQLRNLVPGFPPIFVIPNGVDCANYDGVDGIPEKDTLIYSGALTYHANFDAVHYFLSEIFPLVLKEKPNTRLVVTGKMDPVLLAGLPPSSGVIFTGYLQDIRPAIQKSWISIVPLRVGGGTRIKILESLALGTPVISTQKGVEGLDLAPGQDFILADTPEDFSKAILGLLDNAEFRKKLSTNGKIAVSQRYDWKEIGQTYDGLIRTCTQNEHINS